MSNYIEREQFEKLNNDNNAIIQRAGAIVIQNDEDYTLAAEVGKEAARREKVVIENFKGPKQASHKAWKAVCDLERKLLTPLQTIKIEINRKLGKYSFEKEEKARKEEEIRIAAERKRLEEEAIKRAEELEKNGAKEEAEQALEEAVDPIMQPTPEPIQKAPKVEGIVHKTRWSFKIVDVNKIPIEYMIPDESKIRKVVQAMKQDTKIAGIEIYQERTTDFRGC